MGIDGNEIADELARQGSSHPVIGPDECSAAGKAGNMRNIASSFVHKGTGC
jgi:hypothetical protein